MKTLISRGKAREFQTASGRLFGPKGLGQVGGAGGRNHRTLLETYYDPIPAVTAGVSKPFFLAFSSSS